MAAGAALMNCYRIRTSASRSHPHLAGFADVASGIAAQLENDAKYEVYLSRQADEIASYRRDESLMLPDNIDYLQCEGYPTK